MKGGRKEIQKKKTFAPASSDFRVQQLLRMRSRKGLKYCPPCPINYRFALCTDSQILDDFLKQYTLYCYLCNTYSTFLFQNLRIRMMHNETQLVVEILLWIRFISDILQSFGIFMSNRPRRFRSETIRNSTQVLVKVDATMSWILKFEDALNEFVETGFVHL